MLKRNPPVSRFNYPVLALLIILVPVLACNPPAALPLSTPSPLEVAGTPIVAATTAVSETTPTPRPQPTEKAIVSLVEKETAKPPPEPTEAPIPNPTQVSTPVPAPKPTKPPAATTAASVLSVADIVDLLKKAMVRIKTDSGSGSGMIIAGDGQILTAKHVIENAKDIKIIMPDDKEVPGKTLGRDEIRDIALVKVEGVNLKLVSFGKSDDLRVGEDIVAIGFPLDIKGSATVSKGIVSAIRKDSDSGIISIQTDAPVNPGNSGGALANMKGEVVGVVVSKYVGQGVEGLAFATALSSITPVLARLKAGEFIEAPFSKAEPTKKFDSKKFLYSFSYPESWRISDAQEDKLRISGPDGSIYIEVQTKGVVIDVGTTVNNWTDETQKKEPDFKVISSKGVSHNISGMEVVYDRLISGKLYRVMWFYSQALAGSSSRETYMRYTVKGYVLQTAIKKQKANIDSFFNSLNVSP